MHDEINLFVFIKNRLRIDERRTSWHLRKIKVSREQVSVRGRGSSWPRTWKVQKKKDETVEELFQEKKELCFIPLNEENWRQEIVTSRDQARSYVYYFYENKKLRSRREVNEFRKY